MLLIPVAAEVGISWQYKEILSHEQPKNPEVKEKMTEEVSGFGFLCFLIFRKNFSFPQSQKSSSLESRAT